MEPAVAEAARAFTATPRPARFAVRSGYTGELLTPAQAGSATFWARQIVDTVRFGPALTRMLGDGDRLLVECGPGRTLSAFALRQRAVRTGASAVLSMLPGDCDDTAGSLHVAAALWCEGHDVAVPGPSTAPALLGAATGPSEDTRRSETP
jgi:acyl transferase domain-containing protein